MQRSLIVVALLSVFSANAQNFGFPFGKTVTLKELQENTYPADTGAAAVYLDEFGETSFQDGDNYNLIHNYHAKIKILKSAGLRYANFEIPLYRSLNGEEKLLSVKASAFSYDNNTIVETAMASGNMFVEKVNKYWREVKVAVPNVRVGSIIEVQYQVETPYIYNFKTWLFQADIPKVKSEYVASIPAVYTYNVSLTGFLKLTNVESKLVKGCLSRGDGRTSGFSVDCSHFRYRMTKIPAFVEEDYMTSKNNFISAIRYELAQVRHIDGRVDKITMEWKDAERELKTHDNFGVEMRKNGDLLKEEIANAVAGETNTLEKAKKIYAFIQRYFAWDGDNDKYANGIKAAVQNRKGSAADINLFLVAAMRQQDLDASPVILSTRDNGIVPDLYPVLSSFNYVIGAVNIDSKTYLVDATDDFHPFGTIPAKCINGKGRLLDPDGSSWIDLKPEARGKQVSQIDVKLGPDGVLRGRIESTMLGYEAVDFRKKFYSFTNETEYLNDLKSQLPGIDIREMKLSNIEDIDKPVVRELLVEMPASDPGSATFLFNPYLLGKWKENPFKSTQRLYPVDFGTPIEVTTMLNMEFPGDLEIVNLPENVGVSLPNSGGRYIVNATGLENKLMLTNSLQINKPVFSSEEYHYLRRLFEQIVEVQNADLMFRKKT